MSWEGEEGRKQKEASRENGMKVAQKRWRRKEAMTEGAQDEKCILQLAPQMTTEGKRKKGRLNAVREIIIPNLEVDGLAVAKWRPE